MSLTDFGRRQGAAGSRRNLRVPAGDALVRPWSGYESSLVLALDARFGVSREVGVNPWSSQGGAIVTDVGQSNTSKQPEWTTFNSRRVVLFDDIDDRLKKESLAGMPAAGSSYSIFVVAKLDVAASNAMFEFTDSSGDTVNTGLSMFFSAPNVNLRVYDGAHRSVGVGFSDTTDAHVFEAIHETADRSIRVDGGTKVTDSVSKSLVALENLYVGTLGGGVFQSGFQFHSLLVFSPRLADADMSIVRNSLGKVWGISLP